MKDFYELFTWELKNIYSAQKMIVDGLPGAIKAASSDKLKEVLREHLKDTKMQVKRLAELAKELKIPLTGHASEGMTGLFKDLRKVLHTNYDESSFDAALITCMQRMEHYEIASYATLKTYARHLRLKRAENLFDEFAHEDGACDKRLTELAEGTWFTAGINVEAHRRYAA